METNKEQVFAWIKVIMLMFTVIISIFLIGKALHYTKLITGEEIDECAYSPYNTYSNLTEGWSNIKGDKCYIPVTKYYQTKKECGTFGFSCYEASEPHTESYTYTVCFYKETGELC